MTTHLADPVLLSHGAVPWCGRLEPGDDVISLDEAQNTGGRHFDCVDCHRRLTDGRKHSHPEG